MQVKTVKIAIFCTNTHVKNILLSGSLHSPGVPGETRKDGGKAIFKRIMMEIFPEMKQNLSIQIKKGTQGSEQDKGKHINT